MARRTSSIDAVTQETMDKAMAVILASPLKRCVSGGGPGGYYYAGNPSGEGPSIVVGPAIVLSALERADRVVLRGGYYYAKEV